jgi:hypothetical protein
MKKIAFFSLLLCCCLPLFAQKKCYFTLTARQQNVLIGKNDFTIGLYQYDTTANNSNLHVGWKNNIVWDIAANENSLFISGLDGVQRSQDKGKTWKLVTDWKVAEALTLAVSPIRKQEIVTGTSQGIFKSTDNGNTWQPKNYGLKTIGQHYINALLFQQDTLWAGTSDGLLVSYDAGETWQQTVLQGREVHEIVANPFNSQILCCATEDTGIFLSQDGGQTWKQINEGLQSLTFYSIAFSQINKTTLYAGGYQTGLYKSENLGEKWEKLTNDLANKTIGSSGILAQNDIHFHTNNFKMLVIKYLICIISI